MTVNKTMRIALLQLNQIVGDLEGNADRIEQGVIAATKLGTDLIATPELSLLGYLPKDLLLSERFIGRSLEILKQLALRLQACHPVLVGVAEPNQNRIGRPLFNSSALLHKGKVQQFFRKVLLPTYDVFDEDRYFEPATDPQILKSGDLTLGISICEDIWNDTDFWHRQRYHKDPVLELIQSGAQCIINMSASPFTVGKQQLRESMLSALAVKHHQPLLYVNQVGGNDDLIFDGRSCAFNKDGKLIARGLAFKEDVVVVDVNSESGVIQQDDFTEESEIWNALVLGTRDYVRKCGFSQVLLGLSGGIDSAVTATIAVDAIGADNVLGVLMPSPYSSKGSLDDSNELAHQLGIHSLTLPIKGSMDAYGELLREAFTNKDADVTEENIQARIRGNILMALSNKFKSLLLTTGNKSELAVGYCTLYGDMSGGLAVISDVPKTMIYRLARWINAQRKKIIIPNSILTKAPSAELRPNQKDQDSLPDYDMLDKILEMHIEKHYSAGQIIAAGFQPSVVYKVLKLIKDAEFKRKQAAPGIKVTDRAFGTGWRMPIACTSFEKELNN
jgi:NAD+ synthase/NAD+ synthase (glutamine-hydrolysing)